ncbi:hypothetical protein B1207_06020 [Legionella quinlivanii]|uniref:Uncharacterized protein n=1 Tax=Legionella quinlivanii TaxID=45073 RepID=A0A364LK53_9GAMM|nr:hypothetical protein [Legionella quinlivanii]RAP36986.1 hypothetical protein B1207_06020 [Legionella quinlivanii]
MVKEVKKRLSSDELNSIIGNTLPDAQKRAVFQAASHYFLDKDEVRITLDFFNLINQIIPNVAESDLINQGDIQRKAILFVEEAKAADYPAVLNILKQHSVQLCLKPRLLFSILQKAASFPSEFDFKLMDYYLGHWANSGLQFSELYEQFRELDKAWLSENSGWIFSFIQHMVDRKAFAPEEIYRLLARYNDLLSQENGQEQAKQILFLLQSSFKTNHKSVEYILWSNIADYFTRINPALHDKAAAVVANFIQLISDTRGNPGLCFEGLIKQDVFNFSNQEIREFRILLMNALTQRIFHTQELKSELLFFWNESRNDCLLKDCFAAYACGVETALQSPSIPEASQKQVLLSIARELQSIGEKNPAISENSHRLKELHGHLQQAIKGYEARWFKSDARTHQVSKLKANVDSCFKGYTDSSHYSAVLKLIRDAKKKAMADDELINTSGSRWYGLFKHNGKGYSRYYQTLNQMHDMVLAAWGSDNQAINELNQYYHYIEEDITETIKLVSASIKYWLENDKTYQAFKADNSKRSFFYSENRYMQLSACDEFADEYQSGSIKGVSEALLKIEKALPPYIKNLVNELKQSLDVYQRDEPNYQLNGFNPDHSF